MSIDDLQRRIEKIHLQIEALSPGAVDELFLAIQAVEKENPEARNRKAIAEWSAQKFFQCMCGKRALGHPEDEYRGRIQKVTERLDHPLVMALLIETIANTLSKGTGDPLMAFDELLSLLVGG
jgi:hypothetical protein